MFLCVMVWGKKTVNGGRLWKDGHSGEEGVQTAVIWGPRCPLAVIPGSGRLPRSALAAVRGRAAWPGTNNLPVARQRRATGRRVTTSGRAGVAGRTESPAAPRFVDIARQPPRRCQGNEGRLFPVLKKQEPVLGPARRPGNCREKKKKKQFLPTTGTVSGFGGWVRSTPRPRDGERTPGCSCRYFNSSI